MASNEVDASVVAWIAPETAGQEELAEKLASTDTPEEAVEVLQDRRQVGEFREFLGNKLVELPDGGTGFAPEWGDHVVWVDDAPDDREDPAGHFERYTGDLATYSSHRRADEV